MSAQLLTLTVRHLKPHDGYNRQLAITKSEMLGGGEGIRTPDPRVANAVLCQLSYAPDKQNWLRGRDLNPRPLGYEPNELPDCSTPRHSSWWAWVDSNYRPHAYQACALTN